MGKMIYRIGRVNQSNYFLKLEKEKLWGNNEILTEQFHVPFLDLLYSIKDKNIHELFLESILKKYDLETIKKKEKDLSSFLFVFMYYINSISKKKREELGRKYSYPDYNSNSKTNFRDYIKYLGHYHNECGVTISISNQIILQSTTKEDIQDKEKEISDFIVDDCELILNELFTRFNGSIFYKDCLERGNDKRFEKQFLSIQDLKIREGSHSRINKILKKNPNLNVPNLIKQCGTPLINYLLLYHGRSTKQREWEIFHSQNGNVFIPFFESDGYYFITLKTELQSFKDRTFLEINTVNGGQSNYILDINIPLVKQVHVINDVEGLNLELTNIIDEKSINGSTEYVPVLSEDRIPCLLDFDLFCKYKIDNNLFYKKEEIVQEINKNIDLITDVTEDILQQEYMNEYINNQYSKCNFLKDLKKTNEINDKLLKNFHFLKTQSYFLHNLIHQYKKEIIFTTGSHQFVIPDTLEQENEELGRRTELIVHWYLRDFIEYDRWFYIIDEEDVDKRITNYSEYPFKTIPVCKTIWNNQTGESYKPYDFSLKFRNEEYKIEVKSTRGDEENIFFISVKELEELLKDPEHYFILRLSYIKKGKKFFGIQFNDEFYGCFYKIKPENVELVKKELPKWREYYKTNTIRFTVDQFELIPDTYYEDTEPKFYSEPSVMDSQYWIEFKDFVQKWYFDDLDRILDTYSLFPEVSELKKKLDSLKSEDKYHVVHGLVKGIEISNYVDVELLDKQENVKSEIEDDLPF